jgi:cytochrome c biogenesis protein CcmG, thiol:disulfide interchange protein DsbE
VHMAILQYAVRRPFSPRGLLSQYPYLGLVLGIALLVGAVWLMEGGRLDTTAPAADASVVSLTGIQGVATPRVGEPAPTFSLVSIDGSTTSLSDLRGHPVLVNFWASWCPPCRGEMPDIDRVAAEYRDSGLVVVGVDLEEDREPVARYAQTLGLGLTLLLDPGGSVSTRYNVTGLPTSYFVDRDGLIRDRNVGPLTPKGLRSKVAQILE